MQPAINSIIANGGGVLTLPPKTLVGIWDLGTVNVPLRIVGVPGVSVLKWPDSTLGTFGAWSSGNPPASVPQVIKVAGSNVVMSDFVIDGNKNNQNPNGTPTTIQGCGGIQVVPLGDTAEVRMHNIEVRNTIFSGVTVNGFWRTILEELQVHDSYNNSNQGTIWPNWNYSHPQGITAYNNQDPNALTLVKGCHCYNHGLDGMSVGGWNVQVIGGSYNNNGLGMQNFEGNSAYTGTTVGACGIYSIDATNIKFMGVTANNNTEAGINVNGAAGDGYDLNDVLFQGCSCGGNAAEGMSCSGGREVRVIGNNAYNNGGNAPSVQRDSGVWLNNCSDATVVGNVFKDTRTGSSRTQRYGVANQGSCPNLVIQNNALVGNYVSAILSGSYTNNAVA